MNVSRLSALARMGTAAVAILFAISMPLCASAGEDSIETAFRNTYAYKTYLQDDAIRLETTGGVATLTGTVADESHKMLAQETVANLSGVTSVINQLAVGSGATATNPDVLIARNIALALRLRRNVNEGKITVEVKDGVVTLQGEASGEAQRQLITEFVRDIVGVKEVRNEMSLATILEPAVQTTNETLDDASITAQIVTALMTHQSTRTVITRVATRNGEVTLTGIAKNQSQNALIVKVASDIRGVISVKNQMTVENEPGPR